MSTLRHIVLFGLVVVLALTAVALPSRSAVHAQDSMVACDADLILSLYVAEYYFGYGAIHSMMMEAGGDEMMMVDVSTIDKGQYAPLFESMMGMMDEGMMTDAMMMTEEDLTAIMGSMESMMMEEMMMEEGMLAALVVEGEPAECAALRAELHVFYSALAEHNAMMMAQ